MFLPFLYGLTINFHLITSIKIAVNKLGTNENSINLFSIL